MAFQAYPYNGQLRSNEIFSAIYNMIISQQTFADNLKHNYSLVDEFKTDGSMYGDTKLFYATDVLSSAPWLNDSEASNLLSLARPKDPACQAVTLSNFRQIRLTVDNYLSKRAWGTEGAFSSFTSVMEGWIGETKRMYEVRLFNVYIGGEQTSTGRQTQTVDLRSASSGQPLYGLSGDEYNRVLAELVAESLANLFTDMKDYSRDFNDLAYMRSYSPDDLLIVWNAAWKNKIKKTSLVTMFHKEGLIDKFGERELPASYFNIPLTTSNISTYAASTATTGKPLAGASSPYTYTPGTNHANGKVISLIEQDITVSSTTYHVFPGDEIPSGTSIATSALVTTASEGMPASNMYAIVDASVICKIVHKNGIPFMSAFSTATDFFNPRALTETHYLTWGYSDLTYLKNYPFVTVKANQ